MWYFRFLCTRLLSSWRFTAAFSHAQFTSQICSIYTKLCRESQARNVPSARRDSAYKEGLFRIEEFSTILATPVTLSQTFTYHKTDLSGVTCTMRFCYRLADKNSTEGEKHFYAESLDDKPNQSGISRARRVFLTPKFLFCFLPSFSLIIFFSLYHK